MPELTLLVYAPTNLLDYMYVCDMSAIILGIESSCDDTAAAVMRNGVLLSNLVSSQSVHREHGGVIPELASRAHVQSMVPVVQGSLNEAKINLDEIDVIACTQGPGLMGSLIVGYTFARSLAQCLHIPLIEVNHLRAHILAHFIEPPAPSFPFLCLTVSGGHTQLVVVKDYLEMEVIGSTLDDAAGEAFDKSGKMLGLPYPSGPVIDRLAAAGTSRFTFPEPKVPGLQFSFSGLKTAILYFLRDKVKSDSSFIQANLNDLCCSIQDRIVSILMNKLEQAVKSTNISEVAIAGGVSANSALRLALKEKAELEGWQIYIPKLEYCTDNAAMVAMMGHVKYLEGKFANLNSSPKARLSWSE